MGDVEVRWTTPLPRWVDDEATLGLQRRARTTRRALLLAAARLIAAHGYHGTRLADVTVESGTTKGALYFHFPSKRSVAEALVAEVFASWDDLIARVTGLGHDPLTTLLVAYDAYTGRLMCDAMARATHRIVGDEPGLNHTSWWIGRWERTVEGLLVRARDERLLREGIDPSRISRLVLATATGHLHLSEAGSDPDMWDRMNDTWVGLLPAIASPEWVTAWRSSGWAIRPKPAPEHYERHASDP